MYQNYIFDLYGTLVDIETDEWSDKFWKKAADGCRRYGMRFLPDELKKMYGSLVNEQEEQMAKKCSLPREEIEIQLETVFLQLFSGKDTVLAEKEMQEYYRYFREVSTKYICLFPGTQEMLGQLRAAGKKIYLLSNAQRIFTEPEMKKLGIDQFFDGILYSSDAGVKKPCELFFDKLFCRYQLDRKNSVMIGNDCMADIRGAHKYGIPSIYIHTKQSSPLNGPLPDDCRAIGDIREVCGKLF